MRASTKAVTERTSSGCDLTVHDELRLIGHPPAGSDDRVFLLSLGIEPYDPDLLDVKAPHDLENILISGLALAQFMALLAGVIWTYLRLS
jgi:hypothetical protein